MANLLSLGKSEYLGRTTNLRSADGVIFSQVSAERPEIGHDVAHFHENPIITFALEGESVERSDRTTELRSPGDIRFQRSGELHQVDVKNFPSRLISFEFERHFFVNNSLSELAIDVAVKKDPRSRQKFLRIYKEFLNDDDLTASSTVLLLLDLFAGPNSDRGRSRPKWVAEIRELLNDRWNEPLSLTEMSAELRMHPVTISKYFNQYFGDTLGDYIRRIRIEASIALIKKTNLSLTEIALHCGFSDQSHFTRTFKSFTGFLPKVYRKL